MRKITYKLASCHFTRYFRRFLSLWQNESIWLIEKYCKFTHIVNPEVHSVRYLRRFPKPLAHSVRYVRGFPGPLVHCVRYLRRFLRPMGHGAPTSCVLCSTKRQKRHPVRYLTAFLSGRKSPAKLCALFAARLLCKKK